MQDTALPPLDPATLFFALSAIGFVMAAISAVAARSTVRHRPAVTAWCAAMVAAGVAGALLFLRGHAPWFLTFVVANAVLLLVPCLGLHAHARLLHCAPAGRAALGFAGVATAVLALHLAGVLAVIATKAALSALGGMAFLTGTGVALRYALARRSAGALLGVAAGAPVGAAFLVRAVLLLLEPGHPAIQPSGAPAFVGPLLLAGLYLTGGSLGFLAVLQELLQEQALEASRRDGVTGVLTRRAFLDAAHQAAAGGPHAVVMVDLDHFKRINDTHGHPGGDLALAHAARTLVAAVRIGDIVGRYGGEEFCVLLPRCTLAEARPIVERMLAGAREARVRLEDGTAFGYAFSIGYAASDRHDPKAATPAGLHRLIGAADAALYAAKRAGRDRAVAATATGLAPPPAPVVPGPGVGFAGVPCRRSDG